MCILDRVLKQIDHGGDESDYGYVELVVVERHLCVELRGDCIALPMISTKVRMSSHRRET